MTHKDTASKRAAADCLFRGRRKRLLFRGEETKGQIKKFLIDGKLFIRTADGIFDAKGQRL